MSVCENASVAMSARSAAPDMLVGLAHLFFAVVQISPQRRSRTVEQALPDAPPPAVQFEIVAVEARVQLVARRSASASWVRAAP